MTETKKNILVLEQCPDMREKFSNAFALAGYDVQVTGYVADAVVMIHEGHKISRPFNLVLVDISDRTHLELVADVQNIDLSIPVLTVVDDADKYLIIDRLNNKQTWFVDRFIDSHVKAMQPARHMQASSL